MGLYKHVRELWKQPKANMPELWRARLIAWRKEPVTLRISRPTRIDRARSLGYKAKEGFIIVRQKVLRGGHRRPQIKAGRRPKHYGHRLTLTKNYKQIAEERANKKYPNCEVLNSYYVAEDGKFYWYEIILIDTHNPVILKDKDINWITEKQHAGRTYRGLTSTARKSRGLRIKGKGAEKARPNKSAVYRKKASHPRKIGITKRYQKFVK